MIDKFLDVPASFVEPLGRLAIVAGRIELYAALTYRAFLKPLRGDVTMVEMSNNTGSFSRTCAHVSELMKLTVVEQADETLTADFRAWKNDAGAFMQNRNGWLHATWANVTEDSAIPLTATKSFKDVRPTTPQDISNVVSEGVRIARQGERIFIRTVAVARSEAYNAPVPNNFPPGMPDPF